VTIVVLPYDPGWPALAVAAIEELAAALPGALTALEHIGSTAVPGLAAKPIVDLMGATPDLDAVVAAEEWPLALGYRRLEMGMPGRLFYRGDRLGRRTHLHVVPEASWPTRNERLLRDHLRAHPEDVARYAALKRQLAASCATEDEYTRGKTTLVQELTDRARAALGLPLVPIWEE
jgi:GrpB-like predicted nucleotidyltransferase (UPF0157 family)